MKRRNALLRLAALAAAAGPPFRTNALAATPPRRSDTFPAWVPAPGTRSNISLNVMADVDPCPRRNCIWSGGGQRTVVTAWSGAAFATHFGELGAWIITGGGHGDYFGNEVYAFALDSRRWVRVNDPFPGGRDSDVDYDEGEYAPGIPLSSHTYQHTQYLPPSLGGGSKGSLLLVVMYAAGRLARGTGRSHACDLATGSWSRYSVNKASESLNGTSSTAYDSQRRGFWRVPYGGNTLEFLSTADRSWRREAVGTGGGNQFGVDHVCALDPVRDLLVVLNWTRARGTVWVVDLKSRKQWHAVKTTDEMLPPSTRGMSIEWCPPLQCFVCYEGGRSTSVLKLFANADDPLNGTWRWEREELSGAEPAGREKGMRKSYSRFRWAPSINCFVWVDDNRLPVQAWRLRGT